MRRAKRPSLKDQRIQAAVQELKGMILARFPDATFTVAEGDDPEGVYLTAMVDVEDTDEVMEVVLSRMVDMQMDEDLQVFVEPERPLQRVWEDFLKRQQLEEQQRAASNGGA